MKWHNTKLAEAAESTSKIMACAALFAIVLPTAVPNIFLALFLIFSIIAGNYKFKYQLIAENKVALIALCLFMMFVIGLLYTSASIDDALAVLEKYGKLLYIPILLAAFHQSQWKKIGYMAFLSGVTLMMLMSYLTLTGWSPESIYSGAYATVGDEHIVFRSRIAHGMLVAFAAYLFIHHAVNNKRFRYVFIFLALLASYNALVMIASRSGQMVWIALMLLMIYQYLGWKITVLGSIIVPAFVIAILFSSDITRTRIIELFDDMAFMQQGNYATSLGLRIIWARGGWDSFKQNPVFGTGTGSFGEEFKEYIQEQNIKNKKSLLTQNPHNEYVNIGVQLGLLGLMLLFLLFFQQWRISNQLPTLYNQIAKGMIVTILVGGLVNSVIATHTQGTFFAVLSALLYSAFLSHDMSQSKS